MSKNNARMLCGGVGEEEGRGRWAVCWIGGVDCGRRGVLSGELLGSGELVGTVGRLAAETGSSGRGALYRRLVLAGGALCTGGLF